MRILVPTLVACLAIPTAAFGHARLLDPVPISDNPGLKLPEPCGAPTTTTGAPPTELVIGEPYTIKWEETVDHDGHYRIAVDLSGTEDVNEFENNVWVAMHPDRSTGAPDFESLPHPYEVTVTIPNTPCDPCLLQMRQFMAGSQTYYHSCAEIKIVEEASTPGPGNGGGEVTGGCSCSVGGSQQLPLAVILLGVGVMVGIVVIERRRR